jgi:hypothetical protein
MDALEKTLESISKMRPAEVRTEMDDLRSGCDCPTCPSYDKCAKSKDELLFCFVGKSNCIDVDMGCLCPSCPITHSQGLKHQYHCLRGSEMQLRTKPLH